MNEIKQISFIAQPSPPPPASQLPMNRYDLMTNDDLLFSMDNFTSTNFLGDKLEQKDQLVRNQPLSELTLAIIFGLICACLCFLTITGNLLVLITFRRVRTVSIFLDISNELSLDGDSR